MKHDELLKIELSALDAVSALADLNKLLHLASLSIETPIDTDGVLLLASKLTAAIENNLRAEHLGEVLEVDESE